MENYPPRILCTETGRDGDSWKTLLLFHLLLKWNEKKYETGSFQGFFLRLCHGYSWNSLTISEECATSSLWLETAFRVSHQITRDLHPQKEGWISSTHACIVTSPFLEWLLIRYLHDESQGHHNDNSSYFECPPGVRHNTGYLICIVSFKFSQAVKEHYL